jgi:hypothetical protein
LACAAPSFFDIEGAKKKALAVNPLIHQQCSKAKRHDGAA